MAAPVPFLYKQGAEEDSSESSESDEPVLIAQEMSESSAITGQSLTGRKLDLATARLMRKLHQGSHEYLALESDSVYGAAILLPQIARSAGWPKTLTVHAMRSFFFLFGNLLLQGMLIMMIAKEQTIYESFGGQMNLCDFMEGSKGPMGTMIDSPGRLYANFDQWNTRVFVRDSLMAAFPEQADRIKEQVDPGEYGLESGSCRTVCCWLFMMATLEEFYKILKMFRLLYSLPTRADSWVKLCESGEHAGDGAEVHSFKVTIAGIPMFWKVVYLLFVSLPQVALWKMTMQTGFTYIMDTAEISDLIVNAVALGFILTIDELVVDVFFSEELKELMRNIETYPLESEDNTESDDDILAHFHGQRGLKAWRIRDVVTLVPGRFVVASLWFVIFTVEYYWRHCQWSKDAGIWVSRTMYLPASSRFSMLSFALPNFFPLEYVGTPFWSPVIEK